MVDRYKSRTAVRHALLTHRGPQTTRDIAQRSGVTASVARHHLQRMEEAKLIVKFQAPGDRKRVMWSALPSSTSASRLIVSAAELTAQIGDED